MRIIYDDTHQKTLIEALDAFMERMTVTEVKSLCRYEYGSQRVQDNLLKEKINSFLNYHCYMEIGKTVTHKHNIGNNCQYPVYYYNDDNEMQISGYININRGMYGECYVYLSDYNDEHVGKSYKVMYGKIHIIND